MYSIYVYEGIYNASLLLLIHRVIITSHSEDSRGRNEYNIRCFVDSSPSSSTDNEVSRGNRIFERYDGQ